MACNFAAAYGVDVLVCPNKENKEEYNAEAEKIARFMRYFYDVKIVPFEKKDALDARDIIAELKAGQLSDLEWEKFFSTSIEPSVEFDEPEFFKYSPSHYYNILVVPQKLLSDGECGVSAKEQSVDPSVFESLKDKCDLILGQHFNKVADLDTVKKLAKEFNMFVPGLKEHQEVLGIRGVEHRMYHNLYSRLNGSIGIAGTHTWIMLTAFPEIPQVIIYNKNGVENWEAISRAARRAGRKVVTVGFDETTDMTELSSRLKRACVALGMKSF
ncbi:MAG: hypothetical protein IJ532_02110 [Alphaproteobacteria bacterium]|nr:hypothetical protein [Alphaproteobacteria bacterium]